MDNGASSYRRFRDNGDVSGFDEIVIEYSDGLMLYLTSIVGNIWTAEELTEETFFLIGTKKPKFKEKCSFKTWLYTIGRNITLNFLKRTQKSLRFRLRTLLSLSAMKKLLRMLISKRNSKSPFIGLCESSNLNISRFYGSYILRD